MLRLFFNRKFLLPEHKSISVMHVRKKHFTAEIQELIDHTLRVDPTADIYFIEAQITLGNNSNHARIIDGD